MAVRMSSSLQFLIFLVRSPYQCCSSYALKIACRGPLDNPRARTFTLLRRTADLADSSRSCSTVPSCELWQKSARPRTPSARPCFTSPSISKSSESLKKMSRSVSQNCRMFLLVTFGIARRWRFRVLSQPQQPTITSYLHMKHAFTRPISLKQPHTRRALSRYESQSLMCY